MITSRISSFVAMNLLPAGGFGAYVNTGRWSDTAVAESDFVCLQADAEAHVRAAREQ